MEYNVGQLLQETALQNLGDQTLFILSNDESLFFQNGNDGEKYLNPQLVPQIRSALQFDITIERIADRIHQSAWEYFEEDGIGIYIPEARKRNHARFVSTIVKAWKQTIREETY